MQLCHTWSCMGGLATRAENIELVKRLFLAKHYEEGSVPAVVASVLFDNAKEALSPDGGFTRRELESAVNDKLANGRITDPRGINNALAGMPAKLEEFRRSELPLSGIVRIGGPSKNTRTDDVSKLWLEIDYVAPRSTEAVFDRVVHQGAETPEDAAIRDEIRSGINGGRPVTTFFVRKGQQRLLIIAVALLTVGGVLLAAPPVRRLIVRIVDAISSSNTLPEVFEKLRVDHDQGLFVTPEGVAAPALRTQSGSEVRLVPCESTDCVGIQALVSRLDEEAIRPYLAPLGDFEHAGITALQYRSSPTASIIPWLVDVAVIPQQDERLASELAAQTATISIEYDPPLSGPATSLVHRRSEPSGRLSVISELREFPKVRRTYQIRATLSRPGVEAREYRATLHVCEYGFASLDRSPSQEVFIVKQELRVGMPICTTILHDPVYPFPTPGQRDYLWAQAKLFDEQNVIFKIYPPSSSQHRAPERATIDFGDGSRAEQLSENDTYLINHRYRVGDRTYPVVIYFADSPVVYSVDLYVFAQRLTVPDRLLEYITPYPPNPDDSALVESDAKPGTRHVATRSAPFVAVNPTYSLTPQPEAWFVPMDDVALDPRTVRYVVRRPVVEFDGSTGPK